MGFFLYSASWLANVCMFLVLAVFVLLPLFNMLVPSDFYHEGMSNSSQNYICLLHEHSIMMKHLILVQWKWSCVNNLLVQVAVNLDIISICYHSAACRFLLIHHQLIHVTCIISCYREPYCILWSVQTKQNCIGHFRKI